MWKPFFILISLSSLLAYVTPAQADLSNLSDTLQRDFQEPVHIEADREFLDLKNNLFQVQGHVVITQGSLKITADELVIEGFGQELQEEQRLIATGQPATYEQEVEPDVVMQAKAHQITYDTQARLLILEGEAELTQQTNFLKAARITYDLEAQTITAERTESELQSGSNRVRVSLQPQYTPTQEQEKN